MGPLSFEGVGVGVSREVGPTTTSGSLDNPVWRVAVEAAVGVSGEEGEEEAIKPNPSPKWHGSGVSVL